MGVRRRPPGATFRQGLNRIHQRRVTCRAGNAVQELGNIIQGRVWPVTAKKIRRMGHVIAKGDRVWNNGDIGQKARTRWLGFRRQMAQHRLLKNASD